MSLKYVINPTTGNMDLVPNFDGTTSQYVRGDGQLAQLPIISGGGGGQVYYLNGGTSQGTIGGSDFKQLSPAATIGSGVDFTSTTADNNDFVNFITDIGTPDQETVPAGVWIFQCYLSSTAITSQVYATVEVWDGTAFTVLGTSLVEALTNGATIDLYTFTVAVPEYNPLIPTDRIAIRFYTANLLGVNTITLHTQNNHLGSIQTTFTTGLSALNGLTKSAQYLSVGTAGTDFAISSATDTHTFNLPTASATNRGALSSADWTTFNGKQNALTTGNLTDAGTDGITVTGGTGAVIGAGTSISQQKSDATHNGYLSSTDWSTFNGKQNTITATSQQTFVNALSVSPAPLDTMMVQVTDPADTAVKKFSWSNFKVYLLAYFDTIFPRITTSSTGSVIVFSSPVIWNTPASPSASNLTDDLTGAKIGYVQKIYHNKSVAPTVPAGWVLIGTGTYTTSTLNIIFAEWVSGTRVEYWITKPA